MNQRRKFEVARKLGVLGVAAGNAALLVGCDVSLPEGGFFKLLRFGWPEGVTLEAQLMGNFWVWTQAAAWIISIIIWGMTLYSVVNFITEKAEKKGKGKSLYQTAYNVPVKLPLTILPILVVMTPSFLTVQTQDEVTVLNKDLEIIVDVTGFQWSRKFGYVNISADLVGGQNYNGRINKPKGEQFLTKDGHHAPSKEDRGTQKQHPIHGNPKSDDSYLYCDEIKTLGTTEEVPVLAVPEDTVIQFGPVLADVAHSFWVSGFLFKRDTFPYPRANKPNCVFQIGKIDSEKMANHPEDNPGDKVKNVFVGHCAEMYDTYHITMNFEIRAASREASAEYIEFRQANPEATNANALKHIGEPTLVVSTSSSNSGRVDTRDMSDHGANTTDLNATTK